MILGPLQLGVRHRRKLDALQLLDAEIDHLADGLIRAACVDGERAGVAIRAETAEHRVGQPALLAHVLKQSRAHRSAEQRVQHVAGITVVVILGIAADAEAHVALLELLVADQDPRHHLGRLVTRGFAGLGEGSELLLDEIADAFPLHVEELVGNPQAATRIAAAWRQKQSARPLPVHLCLNADGMSRNGVELKTEYGKKDAAARSRPLTVR